MRCFSLAFFSILIFYSTCSLADMGSPSQKGLVKVDLSNGTSVEGVVVVMCGGYESDKTMPCKFEFLGNKNEILTTFAIDPSKEEQELTLKNIHAVAIRRNSMKKSDKFRMQTKFKSKCANASFQEIEVAKIKSIRFYTKFSPKEAMAVFENYSDSYNLDGCNSLGFDIGDAGGTYLFNPRPTENISQVKNAVMIIQRTLNGGAVGFEKDPASIDITQTPKDFQSDAKNFIQFFKDEEVNSSLILDKNLELRLLEWQKTWNVRSYQSSDLFSSQSEIDSWIYPFKAKKTAIESPES